MSVHMIPTLPKAEKQAAAKIAQRDALKRYRQKHKKVDYYPSPKAAEVINKTRKKSTNATINSLLERLALVVLSGGTDSEGGDAD